MPAWEPPAPWDRIDDWDTVADRIGARHRNRDDAIRAVAVGGDYARGAVWGASILQVVLFRHRADVLVDEGGLDDAGIAVDRITTGTLTEIEELLHQEPLAGVLADIHSLRVADRTLRELLAAFRDRYYSAEGRSLRAARALQTARVALHDYESTELGVYALNAVIHTFYAVGAGMGEMGNLLRLPRHLRAGGRILRVLELWPRVSAGTNLAERDLADTWAVVGSFHSLARSHLDARLPEVGAALVPRLERALAPAQRASGLLAAQGDHEAAVWAALAAAAEIDAIIEAAAPGWRERDDYRTRSNAVYGTPDLAGLRSLRAELQSRLT